MRQQIWFNSTENFRNRKLKTKNGKIFCNFAMKKNSSRTGDPLVPILNDSLAKETTKSNQQNQK